MTRGSTTSRIQGRRTHARRILTLSTTNRRMNRRGNSSINRSSNSSKMSRNTSGQLPVYNINGDHLMIFRASRQLHYQGTIPTNGYRVRTVRRQRSRRNRRGGHHQAARRRGLTSFVKGLVLFRSKSRAYQKYGIHHEGRTTSPTS